MFTSQKVSTFLQSAKFSGDAEKPTIVAAFYITPLS